ncbi:DUF5131 family protein [Nocardia sp. NPDC004711]
MIGPAAVQVPSLLAGDLDVWLSACRDFTDSPESDEYCWRADELRKIPAAVRFLSCEPLLGPLPSLDLTGIDWVIAGGESGPDARLMDPDWVRALRDQCVAVGLALFLASLRQAVRKLCRRRYRAGVWSPGGGSETGSIAGRPSSSLAAFRNAC